MLIKMMFEVAPLVCPEYGGEIKIVSIIDPHPKDVKKILKHCDLWDDSSPPSLNSQTLAEAEQEFVDEVTIDLNYFDMIV